MENDDTDIQSETHDHSTVKTIKPPPIFLQGILDINGLKKKIAELIALDLVTLKSLANDVVKVNVGTPELFWNLVKDLRKHNVKFYTYQLKTDRAFKVVIRNLHHSTDVSDIKDELAGMGHEVRNIVNIRHWSTKEKLPLFFVDLEPNENNKTIYELKTLLHTAIRVEAPPPTPWDRAVQTLSKIWPHKKCGGEHDNRSCKKEHDAPPKCGLCEGEHTANYKGCPKYKAMMADKFPPPRTIQAELRVPQQSSKLCTAKSYAAIVADHNLSTTTSPTTSEDRTILATTSDAPTSENSRVSRLEKIVENLATQMNKMMERFDQMLSLLINITTKKPYWPGVRMLLAPVKRLK